ncbi:MAG TPA: glycoside hydrolase family 172 protein [Bryobacteraceae bacterium]|nr:glycoside hydrolase family 172 protein [Bryobacteraceae bacterium]
MPIPHAPRRSFLQRLGGLAGFYGLAAAPSSAQGRAGSGEPPFLSRYARAQNYKSLKQSSFDRSGGNEDYWPMAAGATQELFNANGPGVITHIWFTIAAESSNHLKEIVIRAYWDGNSKPSIEVPVGDFFGLNLGQYFVYQSAFLNCSSIKALNSYFAMPFRKSARLTATNESEHKVDAFYSNIDYQLVPSLPDDTLYFHAQYRQATPNVAHTESDKNLDGRYNHVYVETRGRGHLMGVTLGVLQNTDHWMGEGDDMIFVDDETKPVITGTGSEDYFNGAWDFGGRDGAIQFAHLYNGAPLMISPERAGGRYCLYRWHADNPVTFTRYLKHTMEHGHADDRADNFFSVAYWYQAEPYTDFPPLPPARARIPNLKVVAGPGGAQPA